MAKFCPRRLMGRRRTRPCRTTPCCRRRHHLRAWPSAASTRRLAHRIRRFSGCSSSWQTPRPKVWPRGHSPRRRPCRAPEPLVQPPANAVDAGAGLMRCACRSALGRNSLWVRGFEGLRAVSTPSSRMSATPAACHRADPPARCRTHQSTSSSAWTAPRPDRGPRTRPRKATAGTPCSASTWRASWMATPTGSVYGPPNIRPAGPSHGDRWGRQPPPARASGRRAVRPGENQRRSSAAPPSGQATCRATRPDQRVSAKSGASGEKSLA